MSLTLDVLDLESDGRTAAFEEIYLYNFGRLAHPGREAARQSILTSLEEEQGLKEEVDNLFRDNAALKDALKWEAAMSYAVNTLLADQIVRGTVKGAVQQLGRRCAPINQTGDKAAAQGTHHTLTGTVEELLPGLSAAIGQVIAEQAASHACIDNHHLNNCMGGSVGGSSPVPHIAHVACSSGIDKLTSSNPKVKGPKDNWCYVQTGSVDETVCIGTYPASDLMYWKTYWKETRGSNCKMFVMSAGQAKQESFQLIVYDNKDRVVTHIRTAYHRDFIFISKNTAGTLYVAHGKGQLHKEFQAGKIELHSYDY